MILARGSKRAINADMFCFANRPAGAAKSLFSPTATTPRPNVCNNRLLCVVRCEDAAIAKTLKV